MLATHWILAGRSEQVAGPGDWLTLRGPRRDVVIVTRQPDGSLAAFHNVCQHRGPAIRRRMARDAAPRRFTCPYHGWVYDTTGMVGRRAGARGLRSRSTSKGSAPAGRRRANGAVGCGSTSPAPTRPAVDGGDRRRDHGRPRPLQHGGHDPARRARVGRAGELQGDRRRLQRDLPHQAAARRRPRVVEVGPRHVASTSSTTNYMCFVPRADRTRRARAATGTITSMAICHYVVFPNTVFNCNPEHIQVFNPIPIDVDRTRFLCWEMIYPGDEDDPEYAGLPRSAMQTLGRSQACRRRGHRDLRAARTDEALERLHAEHPQRARVQDRPLPRDDGPHDPGLTVRPYCPRASGSGHDRRRPWGIG